MRRNVKVAVVIVIGIISYLVLNRRWRHTISQTPVDEASPGDLEELVGNAGGLAIFLLLIAATLAAVWLLK